MPHNHKHLLSLIFDSPPASNHEQPSRRARAPAAHSPRFGTVNKRARLHPRFPGHDRAVNGTLPRADHVVAAALGGHGFPALLEGGIIACAGRGQERVFKKLVTAAHLLSDTDEQARHCNRKGELCGQRQRCCVAHCCCYCCWCTVYLFTKMGFQE